MLPTSLRAFPNGRPALCTAAAEELWKAPGGWQIHQREDDLTMELTPLSSMLSLPGRPRFGMFCRRSRAPQIGLLLIAERAGGDVVRHRCLDRDLDRIAQRERDRGGTVRTISSCGTEVRYRPDHGSAAAAPHLSAEVASRTTDGAELTAHHCEPGRPDSAGNGRPDPGCIFDRFREAQQWRETFLLELERTEEFSIEIPAEIVDKIAGALRQVTSPTAPVHRHANDVTSKVLIETEDGIGSGTGWPVAPGQLITNAHVAGVGDRDVSVEREGGLLDALVAHSDPAQDVAVLSVPGLDAPPLPLAEHDPAPGTPAVMLGYAHGGPLCERPVTVTGEVPAQDGWPRALVLDECPIPGDSGGPIVDYAGQVIGMTVGGDLEDPHVGYAIPPTAIQQLIGSTPAAARQAAVDAPDRPVAPDEQHRQGRALRCCVERDPVGVDRQDTGAIGGVNGYQQEPCAPWTHQWSVLQGGDLSPWMSDAERAARDHDELGRNDHQWIVAGREVER